MERAELGTPQSRDGFDIYKVRVSDYSLLPVSKFEHGAMLTVFGNMRALKKEQGSDSDARDTAERYAHIIDFEFTEQYMQNNFLSVRDNEEIWQIEKENVKKIRCRQDLPIIGRFF